MHVARQVRAESPPLPPPLPHVVLGAGGLTGGREDQQECEIGGRFVQDVRRVAHGDADGVSFGDVNVVVAHSCVGHDAEEPRTARVQHGRVDAVGQMTDDPVEFRSEEEQSVCGRGSALVEHLDLQPGLAQRVRPAVDQRPRDQDSAHATRS